MGKPTICIGENKGADQLRGNRQIVQFLFYLNPKFQASTSLLCLYRPVCVGPVRKPHCWFSHEGAHIISHGYVTLMFMLSDTNEPPRGKTNNVVSEQVRHKPTCTSTEES